MTDFSTAPEDFAEQVKQALDHLYNFSQLQRLPLAQKLGAVQETGETAGVNLRRELIQAIESLNPGDDIYYRSPDGRLYNLLNLHYIGRMTITEVSIEMGISERQTYRDLKRGQGAIADILWSKFGAAGSDDLSLAPVQSEIARLKEHFQPIDLHDLLNNALSAVERLAVQHEVSMNVEIARPTPVISANAPIAQQILVKLLSFSIKQANPGPISIILTNTPEVISLTLQYTARLTAENEPNHVMDELISQLNWHFEQEHTAGITRLILRITAHNRVLLVIDDNEGVADLMTRYLAGYNCRVMSAKSGQEGLKLARKTQPDVILLDVMMPGMDGWELLQRLRSYPETETIPVVVCSVVNDPELSYSLGAAQVISKPVTQENLLNVLYTLKLI